MERIRFKSSFDHFCVLWLRGHKDLTADCTTLHNSPEEEKVVFGVFLGVIKK